MKPIGTKKVKEFDFPVASRAVEKRRGESDVQRGLSSNEATSEYCPHPSRNGEHEAYSKEDGWYCRACGFEEIDQRSAE